MSGGANWCLRIDKDQELMRLGQLVHVRVIGNGPWVTEEWLHTAVQDHDKRHGGPAWS